MPFISSVRGSFGPQGRFGKKAIGPATYVSITSSGTYTIPSNIASEIPIEVYVVGGGGGASYGYGGGGGGGGITFKSMLVTPSQVFNVTVGGGGANAYPDQGISGGTGGQSSFGSVVAYGGGGCRNYGGGGNGLTGGSGGGASASGAGGAVQVGTGGDVYYGNIGGDGGERAPASPYNAGCGAGGGAGSAAVKGAAGAGIQFWGLATYYGAGGRGHGYNTNASLGTGGVEPAWNAENTGQGSSSDSNGNVNRGANGIIRVRYYPYA
jgi:hypothetical protein